MTGRQRSDSAKGPAVRCDPAEADLGRIGSRAGNGDPSEEKRGEERRRVEGKRGEERIAEEASRNSKSGQGNGIWSEWHVMLLRRLWDFMTNTADETNSC